MGRLAISRVLLVLVRVATSISTDLLAPQYHLNDGREWLQDPAGPIQIDGRWLVFPDFAQRVFASKDLVHWERKFTNIRFGETGGIAVTDEGIAVAIGSGFHVTNVTSDPNLSSWTSVPINDPHGMTYAAGHKIFRLGDPARPFKFEGNWYLVMGAGRNASAYGEVMQGEAWLFRALKSDLSDWEFVSVMFASNKSAGSWHAQPTNMFECPDFFPIGTNGKWLFMTSQIFQTLGDPRGNQYVTGAVHHWDQYYIGTFDGVKFTPEVSGVVDYGYLAAGKTGAPAVADGSSRRVLFGWIQPWDRLGPFYGERVPTRQAGMQSPNFLAREGQSQQWNRKESFGSQVLPRDLWLGEDGDLRIAPVPELASLRIANRWHHEVKLTKPKVCFPVGGRQLEIKAKAFANGSDMSGVTVLASPGGEEKTVIAVNGSHLIVDQRLSSLRPDCDCGAGLVLELCKPVEMCSNQWWYPAWAHNRTVRTAPLPPAASVGQMRDLHIFVDGSNLEIFVDNRVALTSLVFPTRTDSTCVGASMNGTRVFLAQVYVWELKPAPVTGVADPCFRNDPSCWLGPVLG